MWFNNLSFLCAAVLTGSVFAGPAKKIYAKQQYSAYMFAYFTGEGYSNGETISFAVSNGNNALNWTEVHGGTPYLTSNVGTTGVRDPSIIRAHDNSKFWLLGTDLKIYGNGNWNAAVRNGSRSIVIWESADLKDWGTPRLVEVSPPTAGNTWAPEAVWDPEQNAYMVFWASSLYATNDTAHAGSSYHRILKSTTTDFKNFTPAEIYIDYGWSVIDTTMVHDPATKMYYRFNKDERSPTSDTPDAKFISQEKSYSITGNWTGVVAGIGKGVLTRGEGPTVFKSNTVPNKWHMFIDEYGGKFFSRLSFVAQLTVVNFVGRGYVPFESTNISAGVWNVSTNYTLPNRPRHGSVIPITEAERQVLLGL